MLLDIAANLFATKGFHGTTVPEIVEAAGVGHGTFYEYFESRRDILLALTDEAHASVSERPEARTDSLADQLRTNIYWYLLNLVEHLELTKIWHEAAAFDAPIAETVQKSRRARVRQLRRWIEAEDPRPDVDASVAATAVDAMIEEFAYRWFVEGEGPGTSTADVVAAAETLCAMALAALGVEPIGQTSASASASTTGRGRRSTRS